MDKASVKTDYFASRKSKIPFCMAKGNEELMHKCFPKHMHGNSKNEIRKRNRQRLLEERHEYGKK